MILIIGILIAMNGASNSPTATLIRNGGFGSLVVFGLIPITREFYRFQTFDTFSDWLLIAPEIYRKSLFWVCSRNSSDS
jgi:hypothetical protein